MSPFADRRKHSRFEVVGVLRGTLDVADPARVIDISTSGALIETRAPIPVGSVRPIHVTVNGQTMRLKACVRRLQPVGQEPESPYFIGVEFVSPPEDLSGAVSSLIANARTREAPGV